MNAKYYFIILQGYVTEYDIKLILLRRHLSSRDGYFTLYATYKELYSAYKIKFRGKQMWGLDFSRDALKIIKLNETLQDHPFEQFQIANLYGLRIKADFFDFSGLDIQKGDVFAVVPDGKNMGSVCLHGFKIVDGKTYKNWWCKGLRNDCCGSKNDEQICEYLTGSYGRFYRKNYTKVEEKDILPQNRLMDEEQKYTLLNLAPEDLYDWHKKGEGVVGELF